MLKELVIASHNQGKIIEIKNILSPFDVKIYSADELQLPDVKETGSTFAENATLKAETLSSLSGKACLADDSGLCVDALDGRPGIYSARYAPNRNFNLAMSKLIYELQASGSTDWSAHFSCVIALKTPNTPTRIYEGRINGKITPNRRGNNGFGYDPIFIPDGFDKTFAELSPEEKSTVSNRGRALKLFLDSEFNGRNL